MRQSRPSVPREAIVATRRNKFQSVAIERIHAAIESGTIDVMWESQSVEESVTLTDGELARLMIIMFPEDYPERPFPKPTPTTAPPGSPRKIAELSRRLRDGLSLFHSADADMNKAKSGGVVTQGTRCLRIADDESDDDL